jgi:ADP-ribose pyrophosphatase
VSYPRIVDTQLTVLSPWVTLVEKAVQFAAGAAPQTYHCVTQADYVGILAITADGMIPIVRQYRPAVEDFTWEFPAGTVDGAETPEQAARRELLEEAGMRADEIVNLGTFIPDTGRVDVGSHAFFARGERVAAPAADAGVEVRWITAAELHAMMRGGEFRFQLHWGIIAAALVHGVCPEIGQVVSGFSRTQSS